MIDTRSVVVELAGLPGSGKTTLATALQLILHGEGIVCTVADSGVSAAAPRWARVARRTGYGVRALLDDPADSGRAVRAMVGSGQESPRDVAAVTAQWLATGHLVSRARTRPGVHLLEEGVLQTVWTAMLRARRQKAEALWENLPRAARSDLVLLLDVSPALAADRLGTRSSRHSRTQASAPAEQLAELTRGQRLLDELVGSCPVPVQRVDVRDESVRSLAQRARDGLLDLVQSPDLR